MPPRGEQGDTLNAWKNSHTRHGTPSGWSKHQKLNERPCDACYRAKQEYDKQRLAIPENRVRARAAAAAQGRARSRLARKYPDEYRAFYEEELAHEYTKHGITLRRKGNK